MESKNLKPGKEYRPHITVQTDAGTLRPQLIFRKAWPWIILEAVALAAVIAVVVMLKQKKERLGMYLHDCTA